MSLVIHPATIVPARAPQFREKDAVCVEARAICKTAARPRPQHSFQDQQSHIYLLAQMAHQHHVPANDVATAYRQSGMTMAASTREVRI